MFMKRKKLPIELIEWVDAVADIGWEDGKALDVHTCYSVGKVVHETERAIIIAGTFSDNEDTNCRMAIPKAWIVSRRAI